MPGKSGLEVAQILREQEKSNKIHRITIISITNDPNAIIEYKHLFDYHISKPFSKSEISSVMQDILQKQYCI